MSTWLEELGDEQAAFEEEQNKRVKIPKGTSADLHLEPIINGQNPSVEEVDDLFNKGKRKKVYTFKVVNLNGKSDSVKDFTCSQSTFKKIKLAILEYDCYDLNLFNPKEQNAGMVVRKSDKGV